MAKFSKSRWPGQGPVRDLLSYLDELHRAAGQPSLTETGRAVALAPSTISGFLTGRRLIGQGNLELLVEFLGGDVTRAESLRRKAVTAWNDRRPAVQTHTLDQSSSDDDSGHRVEVVVFDRIANRMNRPDVLVGRDVMVGQLHDLLQRRDAVLLHGLGGTGKTALAVTVADQRVDEGKGAYLWLRAGHADMDAVIDALAATLATGREREKISVAVGDGRLAVIQAMMAWSAITLVVIDDVWNPLPLQTLLRALPGNVGVLITSRLILSVAHVIEVGELTPPDALTLLTVHSGLSWKPGCDELCKVLGYHPYAIEIAGRHLKQYGYTAGELASELAGAAHELPMPGGQAESGRESIKPLLDRTCAALGNADAMAALQAFGVFSSGTATVELLSIYLGFDEACTKASLHRLADLSLAKRVPSSSVWKIHDLTFSYARALGGQRGVKAAAEFTALNASNYNLLAAELDNLLGAASEAREGDPDSFLSIVETLAVGGYLDGHGHTLGLLRLLTEAIDRTGDEPGRRHMLLTKLGNAHFNQGDNTAALTDYRQALTLAPNAERRAIMLALIGKVLACMGEHVDAEKYFEEAHAAAVDDSAVMRVLEQHSVAAYRQRDFARVRDLATEGLVICRRLGARVQEAYLLNNLGTALLDLGTCEAIALHTQAQQIAIELDNERLLALTHRSLGADYQAQENFMKAQASLAEALRLFRCLGQKRQETELLRLMQLFGYLGGTST